jgi:serine protease
MTQIVDIDLEPGRRIVISLVEPTPVETKDLRETDGPLAEFLLESDIPTRRLVHGVDPRRILEYEREAKQGDYPQRETLTAYWQLDAARAPGDLEELVAELSEFEEVDRAYPMPGYIPAIATPVDDPLFTAGHQQYLRSAAVNGIDAEWAWQLAPSRAGAGVKFIDVELGWHLAHEEVPSPAPTVTGPNSPPGSLAYHGLANLAIVGAVTNNSIGMAGAAPSASIRLVSAIEPAAPSSGAFPAGVNVSNAIVVARTLAAAGDVILVELQTLGLDPVESVPDVRLAIQLAVNGGIAVVEPAGDAGHDLATVAGIDPAIDSGAIVVAGADPVTKTPFGSNFGTRVNCYAWGKDVYTAGGIGASPVIPDPGQSAPNRYTKDYNASSSASAIVAGAAVVVQGTYKASSLGVRSATQLRTLLHDHATVGSPSIGNMPDLRKLLPDVYIRDNLGDTGAVPSAGALSVSPDIIVTLAEVADPQATYGAGSASENIDTLGGYVESGQDNFVYVRMKNRGTGIAEGTTASVYWATVGTLVVPPWNAIGTTAAVDVGPSLTVSDAVPWLEPQVPATGHYCFVATVHHALDPTPALPGGSWSDFVAYIRNNNNATWRNFNVLDLVADATGEMATPAEFAVRGAPKEEHVFELQVLQRFPRELRVELELPLGFGELLDEAVLAGGHVDPDAGKVRFRLRGDGVLQLGKVLLPAGADFPSRLLVRGDESYEHPLPTVAIRQLDEGYEVGRVTWVLRLARPERRAEAS